MSYTPHHVHNFPKFAVSLKTGLKILCHGRVMPTLPTLGVVLSCHVDISIACTLKWNHSAKSSFLICSLAANTKHNVLFFTRQQVEISSLVDIVPFWFNSGSTYTRWGHTSCPSTADLVYKESMAGSYWSSKGAGANHLCFPFDPEYVPGVGNAPGAYIYGSEYRSCSANQMNSGRRDIKYRNIPCAVCRVQMRSTAIMVPAHNSCSRGWTREYYGFLMAAYQASRKTNYICMDREMETLPGHAGDQKGNQLYGVATQCGLGLDCPPYQAEKPITCAVCTM